MNTPSIGRIVHVNMYGSRVPGVIDHVWSDTCVNITLLGGGYSGVPQRSSQYAEESETSLAMQPNGIATPYNSWTWPPRVS